MKFIINKADILDVLAKVQSLAGRKTNLAITTNVLIRSDAGDISIMATDLETGFEGHYPAEVDSPGGLALNAKKLFEIIKEFPSDKILINETENQWIEISNRNIEYHIMGMNPDEFPDHPKVDDAQLFDVDSESLAKMIEQTVIVTGASDDRRAHITGVLVELLKNDDAPLFRMVSTDGSRLAKADQPLSSDGTLPEMPTVIVPKKGLSEIAKFLEPGSKVQVGVKNNNFIVKKLNEIIIVRLLEGEFPQYQDIIQIPADVYTVSLEKPAFQKTLRRMSILSSESYKGIIFSFSAGRLEVRANNPELGESKEEIQIEYQGAEIEAAFNPRFFAETLAVISDDKVNIHLVDGERPCLVTGSDNTNYLSVIMPMRI